MAATITKVSHGRLLPPFKAASFDYVADGITASITAVELGFVEFLSVTNCIDTDDTEVLIATLSADRSTMSLHDAEGVAYSIPDGNSIQLSVIGK